MFKKKGLQQYVGAFPPIDYFDMTMENHHFERVNHLQPGHCPWLCRTQVAAEVKRAKRPSKWDNGTWDVKLAMVKKGTYDVFTLSVLVPVNIRQHNGFFLLLS